MKRSILVCAACLTMVSIYVQAQNKETATGSSLNPVGQLLAPPAPPETPAPPPPPPPPPPSFDEKEMDALPPVPPIPPVPPVAPALPVFEESATAPVVINSIGYDISVRLVKGEEIVFVKKNKTLQKIRLSTWMADRKYYEKKYGALPPPPPVVKDPQITPPVVEKDS